MRGWLAIDSPDVTVPPRIELNYFSDPDGHDINTLVRGLRYARRLIETDAMQSLGAREVLPGRDCESDAALSDYILDTCETVYHPAGTCKMGPPDDDLAVVDPHYKVHGFKNLRVVDASSMPSIPAGNTYLGHDLSRHAFGHHHAAEAAQ